MLCPPSCPISRFCFWMGAMNSEFRVQFAEPSLSSGNIRAVLVWPVIGLLVLAVALKSVQLWMSPDSANYVAGSRSLTILLILFELGLATWLCCGPRRAIGRWMAIWTFVLFFFVSVSFVVAGKTNCGCLGAIQLNPFAMAIVDLLVIASLVCWKPSDAKTPFAPVFLVVGGLTSIVVAMLADSNTVNYSNIESTTEKSGDFVFLDVDNWIGKPFPLFDEIEGCEPVSTGSWLVVFYHQDCSVCKKLLKHLLKYETSRQLAFVEIPPFSKLNKSTSTMAYRSLWLRINQNHEWFVEAPAAVHVTDGIISDSTLRKQWQKRFAEDH